MNVLSLFDGMSCGRIALERAGIPVTNYFASEVDKWSIAVAKENYPDTKHIGDVTQVKASELPPIDLLIGGSPCQGFSFAGKQLNFDDPRSALFFEFVRLLRETKPKYFLLENVRMKKEFQDIISQHLGVEPIKINSSLVSAQNRVRLYWTNIPNVTQPKDKGIVLKDILETDVSDEFNSGAQKLGGKHKNMLNTDYKSQANTIHDKDGKAPTICAGTHGYALGHIQATTIGGGHRDNVAVPSPTYRKLTPVEAERLQTVPDNYTSVVSNTQRYKMLGNGWTVDVISHILKNIK